MDTKDDTDRKALLTAAIDALTRAAEACAAAGVPVAAGWGVQPGEDLAALLKTRAEAALALLVATEQSIAIGDTVRVIVDRRGERADTLTRVGREYLYCGRWRYSLASGQDEPPNNRIHPHDLARIKRWLVKPAKAVRP